MQAHQGEAGASGVSDGEDDQSLGIPERDADADAEAEAEAEVEARAEADAKAEAEAEEDVEKEEQQHRHVQAVRGVGTAEESEAEAEAEFRASASAEDDNGGVDLELESLEDLEERPQPQDSDHEDKKALLPAAEAAGREREREHTTKLKREHAELVDNGERECVSPSPGRQGRAMERGKHTRAKIASVSASLLAPLRKSSRPAKQTPGSEATPASWNKSKPSSSRPFKPKGNDPAPQDTDPTAKDPTPKDRAARKAGGGYMVTRPSRISAHKDEGEQHAAARCVQHDECEQQQQEPAAPPEAMSAPETSAGEGGLEVPLVGGATSDVELLQVMSSQAEPWHADNAKARTTGGAMDPIDPILGEWIAELGLGNEVRGNLARAGITPEAIAVAQVGQAQLQALGVAKMGDRVKVRV